MKKQLLTTELELKLRFSFSRVVVNRPPLEESFRFFLTVRNNASVNTDHLGVVADSVVAAYRPKDGVTLYGSIADPATGDLYVWVLPPPVNDRVAPRVAFETARTLRDWNDELMEGEPSGVAGYSRGRLMQRNSLLQDFLERQEQFKRAPAPLF